MLKLSFPVSCQTITQKYDILHIFDTCTTVFNKTLNFKRNDFFMISGLYVSYTKKLET